MSLTRLWPLMAIFPPLTAPLALIATAQTQVMVAGYFGELPPGQSWNRLKDGSVYNHEVDLIAAHRTLPIGTRLRLTNPKDPARTVDVTVLDRGPFIPGRDLDISTAAARRLGMIEAGVARLTVQILYQP